MKELTQTKTIEGGFKVDQSLKEKILLIQKNKSIAYVNFFNDGSVKRDEYSTIEYMNPKYFSTQVERIEELMCYAAENYSNKKDFDSITMDLLLGLVYEAEEITLNNKIKQEAEPLDNVVRYYTDDIRSYLGNKKTNETKARDNFRNRQGLVNYNEFVLLLEQRGLNYNGPRTFEEFKEAILSGEKFDINVSIDLKEETQDKKLVKKL